MKKTFTLGVLLLGWCLAAVAQTGSTPNQTPPMSTPSTFPQDQTGQTPSNPATPSSPSAIPPDTSANGPTASNSQTTSVQGCLSQSLDGSFLLVDNSGNSFQLRGDTAQLKDYVGKEIRVNGMAMPDSASTAGAMASSTSGSSESSTQMSVNKVHKVSDSCPTKR